MRSASLGAHERPGPPSLSALLGQQETSDGAGSPPASRSSGPATALVGGARARRRPGDEHGEPMSRQSSLSSQASHTAARGGSAGHAGGALGAGRYRPRLGPRTGSAGGAGVGGPSGEEDEPLLFAMSEIGGPTSRRSLEDGRGGAGFGYSR
jgi:autophagy-related protein 13